AQRRGESRRCRGGLTCGVASASPPSLPRTRQSRPDASAVALEEAGALRPDPELVLEVLETLAQPRRLAPERLGGGRLLAEGDQRHLVPREVPVEAEDQDQPVVGIEGVAQLPEPILDVGAKPRLRPAAHLCDLLVEPGVPGAAPAVPGRHAEATGRVAREEIEPRAQAAAPLEPG